MKKNYLLILALFMATIAFGQNEGDVIITEIMQNPNAVSDDMGEYFEIYNTTDLDIDILNWTIRDNGTNLDTIDVSVVVPANGFVVLGKNADMDTNGGVVIDYQYSEAIFLGNSSDAIVLETADGTTIDEVLWDNGATFPDPNGKSMSLNPSSFDDSDNDDGANWCEAISAFGTQFGTPGTANDICPAPCDLMLSETTATCDSITVGVDTYTATITFTGGGTQSFTISSNVGTIGGNDPSDTVAGNITVTDIEEGTNLTVTITSISCDFTRNINSPTCDPFMPFCASVGDIIFTEIMQNPNAVPDDAGEWFEIHNTTGVPIDLHGFNIIDDNHTLGEEGFTITEMLFIPPGGYLVFANNADTAMNGGVIPDWVYNPSLTLGNGTDGITIQCAGNILDAVVWDNGTTFPDPNGNSMNLNPENYNNTDNDNGANWCESTTAFGTQFGTPGAINDTCAPASECELEIGTVTALCDNSTDGVDTYTISIPFSGGGTAAYGVTATGGDAIGGDSPEFNLSGTLLITGVNEGTSATVNITSDLCDISLSISSPICEPFSLGCVGEGDLIFTEVMQNPSAVSDDMGEWFELHNTTDEDIDLQGYDIIDDNHTLEEEGFTITQPLIISAGGYLVFANNADASTNGGVTPDWVYDPSLTLGNGTDGITIQCSGSIIDMVVWDNGDTFPDPNGKSMNLNADNLNSIDNDDGANWCESITQFAVDFGTPGAANDICPPPCTLELGESTAICDTITAGTDTYTVTLDFSGANAQDFTITVNAGSVIGDDPSAMEAGTITVLGIEEGVDLLITLSSESCHVTQNINSPICDTFVPTCAMVGDIIFTEIMQNPSAVSDDMGEWFEIHNTTITAIDLHGYSFIDDNHTLEEEGFTISEELIIPAGGYLIFANNGDAVTNGGVNADWVYDPSLTLGNGTDGITVNCGGVMIDAVIWDNGDVFPDPNGNSMNLSPLSLNGLANDDGANWCESTSQFATDFGTPGMTNDECGAPCLLSLGAAMTECTTTTEGVDTYTATITFEGGGTETYTMEANSGVISGDNPNTTDAGSIIVTGIEEGTDLVIDVAGGTCVLSRTISSAVCVPAVCSDPGAVVITEIMQNPSAVSDALGEWFEVYNPTDTPLDLKGWDILDDNMPGEGFTIATSLVLPSGGYLVFANNGDAATNGGVTPDYVYDPSLTLGNGTDGLQVQCEETVIDIVVWDNGATFPDPNGASMSLSVAHLNAAENNIGAFWGTSTTAFGDGDFGTPGDENDFVIAVREIEIEGLNVFPNPTFDQNINIVTKNAALKEVTLYNVLGQSVLTTSFEGTSSRIHLKGIQGGSYILKIKEGDKVAVINVIIH